LVPPSDLKTTIGLHGSCSL